MNNQRRKEIAKAVAMLDDVNDILDGVNCDENDAYDNMPENLQDSDRASNMQDNIDKLDDACSSISEIIDSLNEI